MENPYECSLCNEAFDCDVHLMHQHDTQHRLPVSCKLCPYTVCHTCFVEKLAKEVERGYIDCPSCENGIGFYVSDEPNISPFACLLLKHAQMKPSPRKNVCTRDENGRGAENHSRMYDLTGAPPADGTIALERHCEVKPVQQDAAASYRPKTDDDFPQLQQSVMRANLEVDDSEVPAVTQSQPDDPEHDDDDDDETVSEASSPIWDALEQDDRGPTQATQSDSHPVNESSENPSTPRRKSSKRKRDHSHGQANQDATPTVVSPSPKRKRRREKSNPQPSSLQDAKESHSEVPVAKQPPPPRPLDAFITIARVPARQNGGLKSDKNHSTAELPPATDCSTQELQALKHRFKWMDEFKEYLENEVTDGKKLSETNVNRTFTSINSLRLGYGVNYAPKKEFPVIFMKGIKIDLSVNIDKILQDAKAFEEKNGKDKSNGWIAPHPLKKLAKFQQHVLEEIRAQSSPATSNKD